MREVRKADGTWESGKAAPELLREDLRALPSDAITKDVDDPDRVHALDPEHIRDELADKHILPEAPKDEEMPKPGLGWRPVKGRQQDVDLVRLRVMAAILQTELSRYENGEKPNLEARHLWFPEDDIRVYSLRLGNAPPDSERPQHLRRLALEIDVTSLPDSIARVIDSDKTLRRVFDSSIRERLNTVRGRTSAGLVLV